MKKNYLILFFLCFSLSVVAQDIELYKQFNGRYDYTAIGATLNTEENGLNTPCIINSSGSATLNLSNTQTIQAAYLYWSGSGNGDLNVTLNNQNITADRSFLLNLPTGSDNLNYFAAFKDVTNIVTTKGNGTYTVEDIDIQPVLDTVDGYCDVSTNYGGWAMIVIYEDSFLPLNQVSIFDGLQGVTAEENKQTLSLQLNNLSIINNKDAKIGFLAWEGDEGLAYGEDLIVNGNIISNPTLNPPGNAFNGTNSFTGDQNFYNMDLDVYNVENYINIGDTQATIQLHTGELVWIPSLGEFDLRGDLIIINNIITVFNSRLPEPAPIINQIDLSCLSRDITVDYTITNTNSTDELPANTPILFFANNQLVGQTTTSNIIPINGSESGQITLTIPNNIPDDFSLTIIVNEDVNGNIVHQEINPDNNETAQSVNLIIPQIANPPLDLDECDDTANDGRADFDLTVNTPIVTGNQNHVTISYHRNINDAENDSDPILNISNFNNSINPQEIFIRVESTQDPLCYVTTSFFVNVNYLPVIGLPDSLELCDDNTNDELANFNLAENTELLENNQPNSSLSFHLNQNDANLKDNEIINISSFDNTSNPQTIYARLENNDHPECFTTTSFSIIIFPVETIDLEESIINCDEGFNLATFDLTLAEEYFSIENDQIIENYYLTAQDASFLNNPITTPTNYSSISDPQEIFIRVEDANECYTIYSFSIGVENCPPFIPEGFSPNNDGINDTFEISGLYDIFENFKIKIFNRYGSLIYQGNNDIPEWDGTSNKGLTNKGKQLPTGTYYYILNLNDPNYDIYKGWVYLNR